MYGHVLSVAKTFRILCKTTELRFLGALCRSHDNEITHRPSLITDWRTSNVWTSGASVTPSAPASNSASISGFINKFFQHDGILIKTVVQERFFDNCYATFLHLDPRAMLTQDTKSSHCCCNAVVSNLHKAQNMLPTCLCIKKSPSTSQKTPQRAIITREPCGNGSGFSGLTRRGGKARNTTPLHPQQGI